MFEDGEYITSIHMDINALRTLHRVVSEACDKWPGGDPQEQECLYRMKTQLYAALMEYLLD